MNFHGSEFSFVSQIFHIKKTNCSSKCLSISQMHSNIGSYNVFDVGVIFASHSFFLLWFAECKTLWHIYLLLLTKWVKMSPELLEIHLIFQKETHDMIYNHHCWNIMWERRMCIHIERKIILPTLSRLLHLSYDMFGYKLAYILSQLYFTRKKSKSMVR